MVNYPYHNALRATPNVTVALFLEEPVVESEEACSVTGLILRHLVDGVMDSIVVELLCLGSDGELALACTSLSLNAFLKIGLGIPYYITEKLCEFCSMLCLFESISLESLCDFRIALTLCLTAHCQIHADLGALSHEVSLQTLMNLMVATFGNAYYMFAGPASLAFFLYLDEFVSLCMAYRALCRWILTLINVTAYETSEFLFHNISPFNLLYINISVVLI